MAKKSKPVSKTRTERGRSKKVSSKTKSKKSMKSKRKSSKPTKQKEEDQVFNEEETVVEVETGNGFDENEPAEYESEPDDHDYHLNDYESNFETDEP